MQESLNSSGRDGRQFSFMFNATKNDINKKGTHSNLAENEHNQQVAVSLPMIKPQLQQSKSFLIDNG